MKEKGKKRKQKAGRDRVEVSINLEGEKGGFVLSVEARLVLGYLLNEKEGEGSAEGKEKTRSVVKIEIQGGVGGGWKDK